MIYTSTELFNAFLEDTRQVMVRVTIGDRVFDNDNIATLNLEYGSMDGGSLDIGGAFANSLKIGFSELVEGLAELDEIEVEMGAVLPNGTIEYVPMGTFIINEEVMMDRNNNTTSIDALDRMVMLGNIYESTLPGESARIIDIAVDIANQAGVVVSNDFDRLRTDSIQIPRGKTYREAIGIIAQFEVGFATFNRDGELTIRGLKDAYFHVSPEEYTMKGLVKNEVPFRLNGVQCQIGDSENDTLQAGTSTGNQIILNNPSMTQEHLNRIYTELNTLNYYPFTLDWYGHPALEAGDWIEIEDLQGNKFKAPNLHYTLDFNGGLKAKSQAETTSSSEVVYQYKSPLKQEIHAIAARLSASSGNHVYDDLTPPTNPKEGDLWFKPEGPDTIILIYKRLEDGSLDWVEELNTGDTTKNAREIETAIEEIEEAKRQAKLDAEQAFTDAKAHADAELERINTELSTDIGGAIDLAEEAKQDAIDKASQALDDAITHAEAEDARIKQEIGLEVEGAIEIAEQAKADAVAKANQAFEDAKAHADAEILQFSEHFDGVLAEVESDVTDAQATANSAVEQIDTAVVNAGYTSLDETLQNMNHITMNAEQSAQGAITNASSAYSLAQTSISEAQTAQANSLTALSEAEDALEGVSSLNVRVDDVETELELKADNTFLTEDNEVITLSNAITLNAHKFSSDMSRIETRVESLVGEINLVILRGAIEGTRLIGGEVFPNAHEAPNTIDNNTMSEMIDVEAGEQLALSKETTDNDNFWRISFYLNNNYVSRITAGDNQHILTVPSGVNRMWVSYPKGSKPQIVRGTDFLPYRPNIADQMTTDEMVIFRNEYDEYADRTERRLTAIDSEGGSLDVLSNEIKTTADSIRTDMSAYIETKVGANTFAEFYQNEYLETAQEVSRKISLTDVKIGGRNLLAKSGEGYVEGYSVGASTPGNPPSYMIREYDAISNHIDVTNEGVEDYYTFSKQDSLITNDEWFRIYWISKNGGVIRRDTSNENVFTTKKPENAVTLRFSFPKDSMAKVEQGNIATGYSEAFEDTDAKIGHVQTEWTQAHNMFKQTVSNDFGTVNYNVQTLENSLSAITNPVSGRLSIVEQVADGLQDTVMDTTTGLSATRSQMAEGFSQMVSSNFIRKRNFEDGMTGNWGGQGIIENLGSLSPINGMTKAFKWATRNAFEEGNVFDVSPGGTYYVEFVVNTFYAKYPVRFGLNTYGPLGENVGFNVMVEVPSGQPTQKVTGTITIPTTGTNAPYTKARPLLQINGPNGSDLGYAYATALVISPNANNSQITQLEDNINLRVKEGNVVSQINIEAERTLIQTGKLLLDAENTIVTGDFAVSGNAIVGGDMQLNKGLRVMNGTDSVLSVVDGNVRMNVGSLFIGSEDVEDKIGTAIYQNSKSLGLIYTDGTGQEQSLLSIGADGVYVEGKHIILNGQTVVDGDFMVTGGNITLDGHTTVTDNFTVSGGNVVLDADTIVTGDFAVLGDNIILDGNTTITDDFTVTGGSIILDGDTTVHDDFTVTGGNVVLDADTRVQGDFTVSGGNVILDGNTTVRGGFTVLGENVTLDGDTTILGDFSVFGKNITLDGDTTILGDFSVYGKNITLDGDTIVTGDFTVAGDIVGPGISADNITVGELDAGQIAVVNLDANSITSNKTSFVQSAWNSINSNADMNANRLRFTHADGSSTQIGVNGLERLDGGSSRPYHYRTHIGEGETNGDLLLKGVTITLPSDFKNKDFTVIFSLTGWDSASLDAGVHMDVDQVRIDGVTPNKALGNFKVTGNGHSTPYAIRNVLVSMGTDKGKHIRVRQVVDYSSLSDVRNAFKAVKIKYSYVAIY